MTLCILSSICGCAFTNASTNLGNTYRWSNRRRKIHPAPIHRVSSRVKVFVDSVYTVHQRPREFQKELSVRRQFDSGTVPLEQLYAKFPLQRLDLQ